MAAASTNLSDNTYEVKNHEPETLRQYLDRRIANARQIVEDACIAKAKAETLGLLDVPHAALANLVYPSGPF